MLLKGSPIHGGFVFWQEEISELQDALDHLRLVQDELRDIGDILKAANAQKARKLNLEEQTKLYPRHFNDYLSRLTITTAQTAANLIKRANPAAEMLCGGVRHILKQMKSKRQTSPRIKGRHLKESCCSPRWRSFIYEAYSILPGHLREAAFQPMLHQFCSVAARFAGAIADNGTDLSRSPSPFQSDCRSRCWPVRRPAYWQTAIFLPITKGL